MPAKKARQGRTTRTTSDPPTIAEVRAIRKAMWKEAGGDINALIEMAKRETGRTSRRARPGAKSASRKAA